MVNLTLEIIGPSLGEQFLRNIRLTLGPIHDGIVLLVPIYTPFNKAAAPLAAQTQPATAALESLPPIHDSPLIFMEEEGESGGGARFQVRGSGGTIWLTENAIWMTVLDGAQTGASGDFAMGDLGSSRDEPRMASI